MTPEEQQRWERIDRLVEFLAANQAQLSARTGELSEESRRHSEQIAQHSALIAQHSEQIAELRGRVAEVTGQVQELGRYLLDLAHIVEERTLDVVWVKDLLRHLPLPALVNDGIARTQCGDDRMDQTVQGEGAL